MTTYGVMQCNEERLKTLFCVTMCFTLDMQNTFARSNIVSDLKLFAIISLAINRSRYILF